MCVISAGYLIEDTLDSDNQLLSELKKSNIEALASGFKQRVDVIEDQKRCVQIGARCYETRADVDYPGCKNPDTCIKLNR